jgi:hypothetical protein
MILLPGIWGASENYITVKINSENILRIAQSVEDQWNEYTAGLL